MADKKKKQRKSQLPFRLNILFFVVFVLFSALIIQLGVVQILNGQEFQDEIDETIEDTTKIPVPRGKIYDRDHNEIADNESLYSITYTPAKSVQAKDRLDVAENLSKYMSMFKDDKDEKKRQIKSITSRDKKEYWYLKHKEEVKSRVSKEADYQAMLDSIKDEEISDFTQDQLEVILIKKELDKAPYLTSQVVKNEDITPKEYASVAEHLKELPGINATTGWERAYPYDDTFRNFIGSITSQEQGILAEKEQYYLTHGYQPNDRVGRSGLEEEYESILRGRKQQMLYETNKDGQVVDSEVVVEGKPGKDLVLTVDMDFQKKVDNIVKDELKKTIKKDPYVNRTLENAYAVVLDPQTGDVLAASGQHYDREEDKIVNNAQNTVYGQYIPGSAIKGATVLSGYASGVIDPGQVFVDKTLEIKSSDDISSVSHMGPVNDLEALKKSSNVYMANIAMRMGGDYNHKSGEGLDFTNDHYFEDFRRYFWQFGLGSKTGIDFPNEATGFKGKSRASKLLFYSFGQYDTYTPMQMAQYVSTIANDGYRVRPHFLKEIREPSSQNKELGPLDKSINTNVLNKVEMKDSNIKRVQEGFRRAFQEPGGTGYSHWADKSYNPAGKTGTAENDGRLNLSLVGYAPFDDPEIAFAITVPDLGEENDYYINHSIGTRIMDAYFDKEDEQSEE